VNGQGLNGQLFHTFPPLNPKSFSMNCPQKEIALEEHLGYSNFNITTSLPGCRVCRLIHTQGCREEVVVAD
jgi:hypothetical protein